MTKSTIALIVLLSFIIIVGVLSIANVFEENSRLNRTIAEKGFTRNQCVVQGENVTCFKFELDETRSYLINGRKYYETVRTVTTFDRFGNNTKVHSSTLLDRKILEY